MSPQPNTFDLKTWDGFDSLPRQLDLMTDTQAINRRLARRRDDPRRARTGTFSVPRDATPSMHESIRYVACSKFVALMARTGWTLASKLAVAGPYPYRDVDTYGLPRLDRHEYRVTGLFTKQGVKPQRIEVPAGLVRRDPEQQLTVREAVLASQ